MQIAEKQGTWWAEKSINQNKPKILELAEKDLKIVTMTICHKFEKISRKKKIVFGILDMITGRQYIAQKISEFEEFKKYFFYIIKE